MAPPKLEIDKRFYLWYDSCNLLGWFFYISQVKPRAEMTSGWQWVNRKWGDRWWTSDRRRRNLKRRAEKDVLLVITFYPVTSTGVKPWVTRSSKTLATSWVKEQLRSEPAIASGTGWELAPGSKTHIFVSGITEKTSKRCAWFDSTFRALSDLWDA